MYHRVWSWLRKVANHDLKMIPTTRGPGIWILPGQKLTSLGQIAEGVSYVENTKRVLPDKRTIDRILNWLVYNRCITVTSNAHATLITITNWDIYNGSSPLHVTDDVSPVQRCMYTNNNYNNYKNDKNNKNKKKDYIKPLAETDASHSVTAHSKVGFDFDSGKFVNVNGQYKVWCEAYPAVDVMGELKKMAAWLVSNPKNRKSDYPRFINNWLAKAQDRAPRQAVAFNQNTGRDNDSVYVAPKPDPAIAAARRAMEAHHESES
jgi:hypothetical protein